MEDTKVSLELVGSSIVTAATFFLIPTLGEILAERSGILNLGIEGMIISSAAGAFGVGIIAGQIRVDTIGGWYDIPGLNTTADTWDHVRLDYRTNTGNPYMGLNQDHLWQKWEEGFGDAGLDS